MNKKFISTLAVITAIATVTSSTAIFASAAEATPEGAVPYSQTRYRYNIVNLQDPLFEVGKNIKELDKKSGKFVGTGKPTVNGPEDNMLYNATFALNPTINRTALKIASNNKAVYDVATKLWPNKEEYETIKMNAGLTSSKSPLQGKPNIALDDTANGIMLYVKTSGINGEGNMVRNIIEAETGKVYHTYDAYQRGVNITLHEKAYDADGNIILNEDYDPEVDEDDAKYANSAHNLGSGNPITFVWLVDKTISYFDYVLDAQGNKIIDPVTNLPQTKTITRDVKKGEIEVVKSTDAMILFPREFDGYMLIPFASISNDSGWPQTIEAQNFSLKNIISSSLYTGFYNEDKGDLWFGDYSFYGPAFSDVDGAFDYAEFNAPGEEGPGVPVKGEPIIDPEDPADPADPADPDSNTDESTSNPNSGSTGAVGITAAFVIAAAVSIVAFKKRK